jgi:hypothetical protein
MSPLDLRAWVTKLPSEELYTELLRRIDALDTAIAPYRETFLHAGRALFESAVKRLGWLGALPELPEDAQHAVVRGGAATIVASHWAQQEYRPGVFLPPVMSRGVPWDTFPDAIHLLDLAPDEIRSALQHIAPFDALDAAGLHRLREPPNDLLLLFGSAQGTIRALGPLAIFDPGVHVALFEWLRIAHYAPMKEEAAFAADLAVQLLHEFLPDLSRRMIRTPDRLAEVDTALRDLIKKLELVMEALKAEGPTTKVLAKARAALGASVTRHDLARWQRMDSRAIALERLARARHRSVKAVAEQLRLAEKAADIEQAWQEFLKYLRTLPEPQQHAIVHALPPLLGPPTKPPSPPTQA